MSIESLRPPLLLPEVLQPWLAINWEFHVIICHTAGCMQAQSPSGIGAHLYKKHHIRHEPQQLLAEYLKQWQWPYDSQSVLLPVDGSLPQPVLPILGGFQYQDCIFKTTNRRVMRQHCNTKHDKKRLKDAKLFQAVQLQTWFGEKRARYWVVDASRQSRDVNNGHSCGSGSDNDNDNTGDTGAAIKAEIEEWEKKEEEEYKASTVTTEIDPWLQYTGWEEVLAGSKHSLVKTAEFTATATADEPELECLLRSWERIIQRSLATLAAVSKYKDILKWWALPKNEAASQKPFELPQNY